MPLSTLLLTSSLSKPTPPPGLTLTHPAVFCTFGYANTFGVFQSYYQLTAFPDHPPSDISWIGSVQLFLQFSMGAIAAPLYDKGYFRHLIAVGSVLYIVRSVSPPGRWSMY